jgi:hypothetical protein
MVIHLGKFCRSSQAKFIRTNKTATARTICLVEFLKLVNNPRTKAKIQIPAAKVPAFRAPKALKGMVKGIAKKK